MTVPFEHTVDLTISNDVTELATVSDCLDRIGAKLGAAHKPLMQLQVALDEIACNVIEHGWPDGGIHELHVRISAHDGLIDIEIDDDGQEFDPRQAATELLETPETPPKFGGVGILLAKRLVDRLDYRRVGGRNRTVITKRYASGRTAN